MQERSYEIRIKNKEEGKMKRNKSGVSLIVLVITIIVMIILATAVMISLSNTGILNKANDAVDATNLKEIQNIAALAWSEAYLDNINVKDEETKLANIQAAVDKALENINTSGYNIVVDGKGVTVKKQGELEAGLYDDNGIMLASWDELVNDYGVEFEVVRNYPGDKSSTALGTIISNNTELQSGVTLKTGDDYTVIYNYVFNNCSTLKNIILSDSTTSINSYAFNGCTLLESVIVPEDIRSVSAVSFNNCPSIVYNEYDNAYYLGNKTNPYVVLIAAKNTDITSCQINNNTKFLLGRSFYGCTMLTNVTISKSIKSTDSYVFDDCINLENVNYNGTMEQWGEITFLSSLGGKWYSNSAITEVICTNGVITIERNLEFTLSDDETSYVVDNISDKKGLKHIVIPSEYNGLPVIYIGDRAFSGCASLISIDIPDSVTSIGNGVFAECTSLTSVDIPNGVTSIGNTAFAGCTSLTSITIPDSVTTIESLAFVDCSSLNTINYTGTVEEWNNIALGETWALRTLATEVVCSNGSVSLS